MKIDYLRHQFTYTSENKVNEDYELVSDCLEKEAYALLSFDKSFRKDVFMISMCHSLLPNLKINSVDSFYDLYLSDDSWCNYLQIENIPYSTNDPETEICQLIDKYGYCIISTITPLLDFIYYYNPKYKYSTQNADHAVALLGYDENSYFYHTDAGMLHRENFVAYPNNKEIGVYSKEKLNSLMKQYGKIYLVDINHKEENNVRLKLLNMLQEYRAKYFGSRVSSAADLHTYSGREAFVKFRKLFSGGVDLQQRSEEFSHNTIGEILRYRFSTFRNSRKILLRWLESNKEIDGLPQRTELVFALRDSVKAWDVLLNKTAMYVQRKASRMDIDSNIERIISIEDRICNSILYLYERG